MSDRLDLEEFLGAFVVEAEEIVATSNAALLEVEQANAEGTSRPRAVRDLYRALHTIKGLAGMIGVEPIVEISHALETLIRAADRIGGSLPRSAVELALQGVAAIAERVRAVAEHRPVADAPASLIEAILATTVTADSPIGTAAIVGDWDARLSAGERQQVALALHRGAPVWSVSFTPTPANAGRGITISTVRLGLAGIGEIVKVVPRALPTTGVAFDILLISSATQVAIAQIAATTPDKVVLLEVSASPVAESPDNGGSIEVEPAAGPARTVVRVELSRLDDLQDQLSLLTVSRFRLEREIVAMAEAGHEVRRLREISQLQGRQLRDLRRAILRARMVRVADVLEPLGLLVRSLARSGDRVVHLELDARDAELDKAVADRLLPALIHLVRNAVDHAIEPPDQRDALGKPRSGTVRVTCTEIAGNHIELVVSDDGRGIDRQAIAARARTAIEDDTVLLDVLTSPGFTTREVATTTSGRGLGMDIVRRIAVSDLGGQLAMSTRVGVGTTFTLRVPVTIAVIDVFSFQCGAQAFMVPAAAVEEIFEVAQESRAHPPGGAARSSLYLVQHRGHAIPVVSLGAVLSIDDGARAVKALLVRRNGEPMAFAVDRLLGRQEVVVRTFDDPLVNVPGIAGATDLGDGRPTLLLDLHELSIIVRERTAA